MEKWKSCRLLLLALMFWLCPRAAWALDLDREVSFNIPAQPLATALIEFSKQAELQLMSDGVDLKDRQSPAISGRYAVGKVLALLLDGSGLAFSAAGPGTILISVPMPTPPPHGAVPLKSGGEAKPAVADASQTQLAEVVVTATKRAQKLRDIPASITELSGAELERRGVQDLQDIVKLVPGLNQAYDGVESARVTIRGISPSTNSNSTTGAIFGDVSFGDAYLPVATLDPNPFDMKSVEVLKGPQGTLYGGSNLNGAIRYVPNGPRFGRWESRYYLQYTGIENAYEPNYGAALNVPLLGRDDMALRLTAFRRESPGYVDIPELGINRSNSSKQAGVRGIFDWRPDDWDLSFTYANQSTNVRNVGETDNYQGKLSDSQEPRLSPSNHAYSLMALSAGYDFSWGHFTSETAYIGKHAGGFSDSTRGLVANLPIPIASLYGSQDSGTYSQELRLSSPEDQTLPWHWLVGALDWKQILHLQAVNTVGVNSILPITLPPIDGLLAGDGINLASADSHVSAQEYALFGELTRRLWQRLEITLGGRGYLTESGGNNVVTGVGALIQPGGLLAGDSIIQGKIVERGFNPKASIALHATDNIMAYAAASRGYRMGGIQFGVSLLPQPQDPVPNTFRSDTIWNYESGIRTEWFHKMLRLDITGFLERWKSPQYYTPDATGISYYLTNVGSVQSKGGEGSLQLLTPWGVMLDVSAAYANTITTAPFKTSGGTVDPAGTPWPYSPKWQGASTLSYAGRFAAWDLRTSATYSYMGPAVSLLGNPLPIFGYAQVDAQVTLSDRNIPWLPELNVSVNNLTDHRGIGNNQAYSTSGLDGVTYIQPRTINLRLSGHF